MSGIIVPNRGYRWTSPLMSKIEDERKKKEEEELKKLENETKPCPFCGMKPQVVKPSFMWSIGCQTINCFCNIGMNPLFKTKEEAIEAWNKRLGDVMATFKKAGTKQKEIQQ